MNPLISKARKPKFELILRIYDLNNIPLVTGISYVKWHLPTSTSSEHHGRTERHPIRDHKVTYDYLKIIPLRLTISKDNTLSPSLISFEVIQDYSTTGRSDKVTIGKVELNLAEYVEEGEVRTEDEEGVVRRYLMQESKINSTLKIGIAMRQIDGERNFVAPPLKTAPVFGGIAGIMAGEQEDVGGGDLGNVPNLSKSRDHGELQDMYRRALAASWAANSGEMSADLVVEDIFNGGDGWKRDSKGELVGVGKEEKGGEGNRRGHGHSRSLGHHRSASDITVKGGGRGGRGHRHKNSASQETLAGTGDSEEGSERGRAGYRSFKEVDEFEVRDDLIAWQLPDVVEA